MTTKTSFLILPLTILCLNLISQDNGNFKPKLTDRLVYGGNLGLQFGTTTFIDISPSIGYKLTPRLIPGVGASYQYFNDKTFTPDYSTHVLGGRAFVDYYLMENLFAHVEYEYLTYEAFMLYTNTREWVNVSSYLVGGGYMQRVGPGVGFGITVLYNLNETEYSLYTNPIIRIGISAGL